MLEWLYSHNLYYLFTHAASSDNVDFADSGGSFETEIESIDGLNALDASNHPKDTVGEDDDIVLGERNVLDDATTIVCKCSKLGRSELCHAIGSISTNVSVVFDILRAFTKLYDGGIKDEECVVVARSKLSGVEVIYCKSRRTGYIADKELHLSDEDLQMPDELDVDWTKHLWEIVLSDSTKAAPFASRFVNLVDVEPHLIQECMRYGKESTRVSFLLCVIYSIY